MTTAAPELAPIIKLPVRRGTKVQQPRCDPYPALARCLRELIARSGLSYQGVATLIDQSGAHGVFCTADIVRAWCDHGNLTPGVLVILARYIGPKAGREVLAKLV